MKKTDFTRKLVLFLNSVISFLRRTIHFICSFFFFSSEALERIGSFFDQKISIPKGATLDGVEASNAAKSANPHAVESINQSSSA